MNPKNPNSSTQSSSPSGGREDADQSDREEQGGEREDPSSRRDERTARPRPEDSPHLPRYGDTEPDGPGHVETAETPDDQRI